jgi:hypothetical protein
LWVHTTICFWANSVSVDSVQYNLYNYTKFKSMFINFMKTDSLPSFLPSFLPLGATAQGELWPPEQSASISLYSSFVQTMKCRMVE